MPNLPDAALDAVELGRSIWEAARALAARDVRVFPCHGVRAATEPGPDGEPRDVLRCTCGRPACANPAKHPVGHLVPHGHNQAVTEIATVDRWFAVPATPSETWRPWNIGVACGRGLVVIDADTKQTRTDLPTGIEVLDDWETWTKGTSLPEMPHVNRTGSGGLHLWMTVDPGLKISSRNRVLPGIDVKADGGYVLAPPSVHISGGSYATLHDREPPRVSPELLGWLLTVKGNRYVTRRSGAGAISVPDDYDFRRIIGGDGCPAGHRDYFVNDLCFRLRRAGTGLDDAAEALRREWLRMENPPNDEFPWETCIYKLRRVWDEVTPEDVADIPAWRPPRGLIGGAGGGQGSSAGYAGEVDAEEPRASATEILNRPELTYKRSDTGNGERFAQRMRDVVRFCVGENRWYLWDGSRWAPDVLNRALYLTTEVIKDLYVEAAALEQAERERLEAWAQTSQSIGHREAMLRAAAAQPGIAIQPNDLDANPWVLACRNGTVDLRTGMLRDSLPEDLGTRRAEVDFDPEARCPLWEAHVEFVTRGDRLLADWLRRAVGYTLTGATGEQQLFFLWGTGHNGKSTFLDVTLALLGSYAVVGDENLLTSTTSHPTQLADLRGARLVVCDETDRDKKLAEQRIKMMTGKKIKARFMRQDFFEYVPRFKVWVSGNHKPEIRGNDEGIWRRIRLVPFTAHLSADRKILDYEEVLKGELSGILNWALEGLADWVKLAQLGDSPAIAHATAEYRDEEDHIGQWMDDCLEREVGYVEESARLFDSWRWWALQRGYEAGNATRLGRELSARGFEKANDGRTIRIDGRATKGRLGLRIRGSWGGQVDGAGTGSAGAGAA